MQIIYLCIVNIRGFQTGLAFWWKCSVYSHCHGNQIRIVFGVYNILARHKDITAPTEQIFLAICQHQWVLHTNHIKGFRIYSKSIYWTFQGASIWKVAKSWLKNWFCVNSRRWLKIPPSGLRVHLDRYIHVKICSNILSTALCYAQIF